MKCSVSESGSEEEHSNAQQCDVFAVAGAEVAAVGVAIAT